MPSSSVSNGLDKKIKTPNAILHVKRQKEKLVGKVFANLNRTVLRLLLESCFFLWILQFVFDTVIPDHQAEAFRTVIPPPVGPVDDCLRRLLAGCQRWDAQHYLHIAMYGYTYENNLAFFPLFPFLVQNGAVLFSSVFGHYVSYYTCLLLSGTAINVAGFCGAGYFLYSTTLLMFDRIDVALTTVFVFALNPASIFFHVLYTESLFSFLTFLGLHCLRCSTPENPKPILQASVCFALSCLIRSNGLLNFGYIAFTCLAYGSDSIFVNSNNVLCKFFGSFKALRSLSRRANGLVKYGFILTLCTLITFPPFLMLQYSQYNTFCTPQLSNKKLTFDPRVVELGQVNDYVFPGQIAKLPWCNKTSTLTVPYWNFSLPYTAVQTKYWNVKFLGYYQWRKIPNFLLATPTILYALTACFYFLTDMRLSDNGWMRKLLNSKSFAPYIMHVIFLTFVGAFFINVEVITRMLFSSSPLLYWHFAKTYCQSRDDDKEDLLTELAASENRRSVRLAEFTICIWKSSDWLCKCLLLYFITYCLIGTILHVNFLPWT